MDAAPGILGLDVETNSLDDLTLRLIQFGTASSAWVLDPADPDQWAAAARLLLRPGQRFVSHTNIDPRVIATAFRIDISLRSLDTKVNACLYEPSEIASHRLKPLVTRDLSDPRLEDASASLEAEFERLRGPRPAKPKKPNQLKNQTLYQARLLQYESDLSLWQTQIDLWEGYVGWTEIDVQNEAYVLYAGLDAIMALRLFYRQLELLESLGVTRRTIVPEQRFYGLCTAMGIQGIRVDQDYARGVSLGQHERDYEDGRAQFEELTGFVSGSPRLADYLLDRGVELREKNPETESWKLGKKQLEEALTRYLTTPDPHPEAVVALELKERIAGAQNYVTFTRDVLARTDSDSWVHPVFNTLGAVTGRMSAVRPAVQTCKGEVVRGIFIPDSPDHVLVSIDMSQIEPRVAAAEANETGLIEMLRQGYDPYSAAASLNWGSGFTPKHRKGMKRCILASVYGGGVDVILTQLRLLDGIIMTVDEVNEIRRGWWSAAPNIQRLSRRLARETDAIWLPSGRYVPQSADRLYKGFNSLIQGTARDVLRDGVFRVAAAGYAPQMRNLIHDEAIFSLPRSTLDRDLAILVECFTHPYKQVPVEVEVEVYDGGRWGHGTRIWTREDHGLTA